MTDKDMLAGLVRGLEWEKLAERYYRAPLPLFGSIRLEQNAGPDHDQWVILWSIPGYCDTFTAGKFPTIEAAKSAAQSDYTARILAALDLDAVSALVGANWLDGYNRGVSSMLSSDPAIAFADPSPPADAKAAFNAALKKARQEGLEMALEGGAVKGWAVLNPRGRVVSAAASKPNGEGNTTAPAVPCLIILGDRQDAAIRKLGDGE